MFCIYKEISFLPGKDCIYTKWSSCKFEDKDTTKCGLGKSTRHLVDLNTTG